MKSRRLCALVSVVMLAWPGQTLAQQARLPVIHLKSDAQTLARMAAALSTQLMDTATLRWKSSDLATSADFVLTLSQVNQALEVVLLDGKGKRVTVRRITTPPGPLREFELGAILRAELSAVTARAIAPQSASRGAVLTVKETLPSAVTMPSVPKPAPREAIAPASTRTSDPQPPASADADSVNVGSTPSIQAPVQSVSPAVPPPPALPPTPPPIVESEPQKGEAPTPAPPLQTATFDDAPAVQSQPQPQVIRNQVPDAWRLRIGAGYHVRWLGQSLPVIQGLGAEAHIRAWRGLFWGFKYGYSPPTVTQLQAINLQLSRHEGALLAGFDFLFRFMSVTPTVSAGVSSVSRTTSNTPEGVLATDTRSVLSAVVGVQGHLRFWLPSVSRLKLDVAPAVELALGEPRYVFLVPPDVVSAAPIPLRPRLDVSAVFEF